MQRELGLCAQTIARASTLRKAPPLLSALAGSLPRSYGHILMTTLEIYRPPRSCT